jgi:hypothetical protein
MSRKSGSAIVATLLASVVVAFAVRLPAAAGQPGLFVGITDDVFLDHPSTAIAAARDLGLGGVRVALNWTAGQTQMNAHDLASFNSMVSAAAGMRIVVTVYGRAVDAPVDGAGRESYCSYVSDLLSRFPTINDVVIWNEPNLGFFWQPQFNPDGTSAAPAAYEALLARCWDVLHTFRPGVNLIMTTSPSGNNDPNAASNVSHSPGTFIRAMGAAYRASGRTQPIFDTVGHNPYGLNSAESPWAQHLAPSHVGEGDLDRLVQALDDGFGGTAQPVPGHCVKSGLLSACVSIWYLETGYQTVPDAAHQQDYTGHENDDRPLPDTTTGGGPTESSQLTDGIELAYCQPYVAAYFNFLLIDEPDLARWQSGVLWADGSQKAAYASLKRVIGAVGAGNVNCRRLTASHLGAVQPAADTLVDRIEWPSLTAFSSFNQVWSFDVDTRVNAAFSAVVVRAGRTAGPHGGVALTAGGWLTQERPHTVTFPARTLAPGTYQIQITVTRKQGRPLTVTRRSPPFTVGG